MSTPYHLIEKQFRDYSTDIEAVTIHYVVTPADALPDWSQRYTLYLPRVQGEIRRVTLSLPHSINSSEGPTTRYLLHYYFEIFQSGDRVYSEQFTDEVVTGVGNPAKIPGDSG